MHLYSQSYPSDIGQFAAQTPPVIIIPGLFGSTSNWRGFAQALGAYYPVVVIDQRNHGRSPHAPSHTYQDMVDDLLEFIDQHSFDKVILCGHSMGGKVAMLFSHQYPKRVAKLAVLDIAPITYPHSHAAYLEAMLAIDLSTLASRAEADKILKPAIPDTATRLFLLQSLVGSPTEYRWRLNLSALLEYMPQIVGFPEASLTGDVGQLETVFIYGESSDYVQVQHHELIRAHFSTAQFVGIPNAGHWLHAEQPKLVLRAVLDFLGISETND
ncbi:alpha/beta fold hydrolase [Arenicella xantha]|uniref:Pimeloyl-ACP methyl ester carboxylesterase n=1 Tax=Arenicella xantha TaxID=644221 RepID=A0A395JHA2_9GAMM|nr:alpha/beta fold hydrolase [Arenicella xantha]RBP49215.1 pimeloyl-ACP methyl ester carboxylesterase [Arenicella xantha]